MKTWIAISLTALVASCATPDQIAKQPVAGSFTSAMSAKKLAACVDHNAENRFFAGAFRSKVRDSGEEPIVVVVHANADYVSTVVEIRSTQSGSVALFSRLLKYPHPVHATTA
jgi:hypothetical protein